MVVMKSHETDMGSRSRPCQLEGIEAR